MFPLPCCAKLTVSGAERFLFHFFNEQVGNDERHRGTHGIAKSLSLKVRDVGFQTHVWFGQRILEGVVLF